MKQQLIASLFKQFQIEFYHSERAQKFVRRSLRLKPDILRAAGIEIGYNSPRLVQQLKSRISMSEEYKAIGLLLSFPGENTLVWGRYGLIFPLKNKEGEIVNLYALRLDAMDRLDIFLNNQGLFPFYPPKDTKRLLIAETVAQAARYVQRPDKDYAVIHLDNFIIQNEWHQILNFCKTLPQLEEIILLPEERPKVITLAKALQAQFSRPIELSLCR